MVDTLESLPPHLRALVTRTAAARGIVLHGSQAAPAAVGYVKSAAVGTTESSPARVVPARSQAAGGPRRKAGVPNRTEAAWGAELELRRIGGELAWVGFEALTLRLATGLRYTPDFTARTRDGRMLAWEVKGWFRDDARAKLLTAAESFPWLQFHLVRAVKAKGAKSRSWEVVPVTPAGHIQR